MRVALGFRAKTGRAIAVALTRDNRVGWHGEISLIDPRVAGTAQPYHAVMELPWPEWMRAAAPFVAAIERVATRALEQLRDDLRADGMTISAAGIIGSADRELGKIGNPHIRAHAAEGILFRRVLESAAKATHLRSRSFTENEVKSEARSFQARLKALGRTAGAPWRADEKAAAAAAWLVR